MEPNCVSYNLLKQPSGDNETHKCELNDVTHEGNIDDLVGEYDYFYHGSEARVTFKLLNCFIPKHFYAYFHMILYTFPNVRARRIFLAYKVLCSW